jgi:hypothetical protein
MPPKSAEHPIEAERFFAPPGGAGDEVMRILVCARRNSVIDQFITPVVHQGNWTSNAAKRWVFLER